MRLDKYLSNMKHGSRKTIKKMAKAERITVNETICTDASAHIDEKNDVVRIDGEEVLYFESLTLMMNKRKGVVSANKDDKEETVFDDLDPFFHRFDLHIAGRLDKDAEGLLILTTDGRLTHEIISPSKDIYKTYEVLTREPVENPDDLKRPMRLPDARGELYEVATPRIVEHESQKIVIQIKEGKFHQVKRMFEAIGHDVVNLKRTKIHDLALDETLFAGEARILTGDEIDKLTKK